MPFSGSNRLVGFGFGAIQAGLFVYEAFRTGCYEPPLVVDVRPDLVASIRAARGAYWLNIAHRNEIEPVAIGPVDIADALDASDRLRIVEAIAAADEVASALPSVDFYEGDGPGSPHRLIAEGLRRRRRATPLVIYCAENHRRAAEILEHAVLDECAPGERDAVRRRAVFVNTVIGKMSGVITDPAEVTGLGLLPVVPGDRAAFLVEEFNHILVSRPLDHAGGTILPGIPALEPVDNLEPYAAAKLLGHNATHALAAYVGHALGLRLVADLALVPDALALVRAAFVEESGGILRAKYANADPMFSPEGYAAFADDLIERMVNPHLADTIERAARDPRRKLGWDDRLVGLIRLGHETGVPTPRYAMGAAAALAYLKPGILDGPVADVGPLLRSCWPESVDTDLSARVVAAVQGGLGELERSTQAVTAR